MGYSLSNLTQPVASPSHITLAGEGGMGKTTLAALMPKAVFIRTEDGMAALNGQDVHAFPLATSTTDVFEQIGSLATVEHAFETLVIDSITQFNTMAEQEIVKTDPKQPKSINQALGGYGAGHAAVSELHRQLRHWCGSLASRKNMNIIYIAHTESESIDPPDSDGYTRYSLRLNKRSVSHYVDNVDCVGFIKLQTFVTGTGARIITCHPTPNHISKNRFGIKEDLAYPEGVNPLAPFIPTLTLIKGEKNV